MLVLALPCSGAATAAGDSSQALPALDLCLLSRCSSAALPLHCFLPECLSACPFPGGSGPAAPSLLTLYLPNIQEPLDLRQLLVLHLPTKFCS